MADEATEALERCLMAVLAEASAPAQWTLLADELDQWRSTGDDASVSPTVRALFDPIRSVFPSDHARLALVFALALRLSVVAQSPNDRAVWQKIAESSREALSSDLGELAARLIQAVLDEPVPDSDLFPHYAALRAAGAPPNMAAKVAQALAAPLVPDADGVVRLGPHKAPELVAVEQWARAVVADPEDPKRGANLGVALEKAREAGQAATALAVARRLLPDLPSDIWRAEARLKARAIAADPNDGWALEALGFTVECAAREPSASRENATWADDVLVDLAERLPFELPAVPLLARIELLARSLVAAPERGKCWYNLGVSLGDLEAHSIEPAELPEVLDELDTGLRGPDLTGRVVAYFHAVERGHLLAWVNLAHYLMRCLAEGRSELVRRIGAELGLADSDDPLEVGLAANREAAVILPDYPHPWVNLGAALFFAVEHGLGEAEAAALVRIPGQAIPDTATVAACWCVLRATLKGAWAPNPWRRTVSLLRQLGAAPEGATVLAEILTALDRTADSLAPEFAWAGVATLALSRGVADVEVVNDLDAALAHAPTDGERARALAAAVAWGLGVAPFADPMAARLALSAHPAVVRTNRAHAAALAAKAVGWLPAAPAAAADAAKAFRMVSAVAPVIGAGGAIEERPVDDPEVDAIGLAFWAGAAAIRMGEELEAFGRLLRCLDAAARGRVRSRDPAVSACVEAAEALRRRHGSLATTTGLSIIQGRVVALAAEQIGLPDGFASSSGGGASRRTLATMAAPGSAGATALEFSLAARRGARVVEARPSARLALQALVDAPPLAPRRRLLGLLRPAADGERAARRAAAVVAAGLVEAAEWAPEDREALGTVAQRWSRSLGPGLAGDTVYEVADRLRAGASAALIAERADALALTETLDALLPEVDAVWGDEVIVFFRARKDTLARASALLVDPDAADGGGPLVTRLRRVVLRLADAIAIDSSGPDGADLPWLGGLPPPVRRCIAAAERMRSLAPALGGDHGPELLFLCRAVEGALDQPIRVFVRSVGRLDRYSSWLDGPEAGPGASSPIFRCLHTLRTIVSQGGPTLGTAARLSDELAEALRTTAPDGMGATVQARLKKAVERLSPAQQAAFACPEASRRISALARLLAPLRNRSAHFRDTDVTLDRESVEPIRAALTAGDGAWLPRLFG